MDKIIVEDVSLEELKAGLADGSIALIDVREPNEWDVGARISPAVCSNGPVRAKRCWWIKGLSARPFADVAECAS